MYELIRFKMKHPLVLYKAVESFSLTLGDLRRLKATFGDFNRLKVPE